MSEDQFDEAVNDAVDEVMRRAMDMPDAAEFVAAVAADLFDIEVR